MQHSNWTQYHALAKHWTQDVVNALQRDKKRLFYGCGILLVICLLLSLVLISDYCKHPTSLLIVHQRDDGSVWLSGPVSAQALKPTKAQVQGDLVRYLRLRLSYDAQSYAWQYKTVLALSSSTIAHEYSQEQNIQQANSVVRQMGLRGVRRIQINAVTLFKHSQDKKEFGSMSGVSNTPMAQLIFQVCDHHSPSMAAECKLRRALIAWHYRGVPTDPAMRWLNWSGFEVTYFRVTDV